MAIQTEGPDPIEAALSLAPKANLEQDDSDNSDAGSFLDDATKDFLPSSWVGSEEKKTVFRYKPRKRGAMKVKVEVAKQSSKALAVARRPTSNQEPQPTPSPSSSETELRSPAIDGTTSTLVTSITPQTPISSTTSTTMCQQSTVTIGRLQVQASFIRQPRSPLEALQEQVKSLKHEVGKKDRDVKSANQRAAASELARAKSEDEKKKIEKELAANKKVLERAIQVNPRRAEELRELKKDRDDIEGQRQKATSELKKLREKHEALTKRLAMSGKKLNVVEDGLTNANARISMIAIEKAGLDITMGQLTRAATTQRATVQRYQDELRQERADNARLQNENRDLSTQISTLTERLRLAQALSTRVAASSRVSAETQTAITDLRNLRRSNDRLTRNYNILLRDYDQIKQARDTKENEHREALNVQATLRQNIDLWQEINRLNEQSSSRLKHEIAELKKSQDLLSPLVKIGVDIRLRNLELARETALDVPTSDLDGAIILSGNVAAHRANGAVDAAIFEAGLVPDGYIEEASKVFKALYHCQPSDYPTQWVSGIKRLLDCRGTIKTVKAVAGSADCSALESAHSRLDSELCTQHDNLWSREDFDTDPSVEERLLRLEVTTEEIVDIKRSKNSRCRRARYSVSCIFTLGDQAN